MQNGLLRSTNKIRFSYYNIIWHIIPIEIDVTHLKESDKIILKETYITVTQFVLLDNNEDTCVYRNYSLLFYKKSVACCNLELLKFSCSSGTK